MANICLNNTLPVYYSLSGMFFPIMGIRNIIPFAGLLLPLFPLFYLSELVLSGIIKYKIKIGYTIVLVLLLLFTSFLNDH